MSSGSPGRGPDLTLLRQRMEYADANPIVPRATNGDQNAITLPHAEMDGYLSALRGPEWEFLRQLRWEPAASGCISREYPGLWVRAMLQALAPGKGE